MATLNPEDRMALGQHFCIGLSTPHLTDDFRKFILEHHIGGIVYFKGAYESPQQIGALSNEIQSIVRPKSYHKLPVIIATDHEGGRVQRFSEPFIRVPPMAVVGRKNSPTFSFDLAEAVGKELKAVGVNTNFAPVLDVCEADKSSVIGDRSISNDPETVTKIGSALVRGLQKGGVIAVPKHFPGHGLTKVDSHTTLPVVDKALEDIEETHMMPFRRALRARCEAIMTAHLRFPKVDPEFPVTLSRIWIENVFRGQLRFQKVVFSDDMEMGALSANHAPTEVALRACTAGVDILVYRGSDLNALNVVYTHLVQALESGEWEKNHFYASTQRITDLKRNPDHELGEATSPETIKETVGCEAHHNILKSL